MLPSAYPFVWCDARPCPHRLAHPLLLRNIALNVLLQPAPILRISLCHGMRRCQVGVIGTGQKAARLQCMAGSTSTEARLRNLQLGILTNETALEGERDWYSSRTG